MSLRSKYAKSVRQTLGAGYHASWYPDTRHMIGSFGRMVDDVFVSHGDIRDLAREADVDIEVEIDDDTVASTLELSSSKGVAVTMKAQGKADPTLPHIPEASVGLGIEFRAEGAFTISAGEVFEDRIRHPGALAEGLRSLRKKGKWDSSYRIVTGVLRMPVATILISQSDNTKVELSLEGALTPSIEELGKAGVSASFLFESSTIMKYAPARDAAPILQLHKFVPRFPFGPPRLRMFQPGVGALPTKHEDWCLVLDDEPIGGVG